MAYSEAAKLLRRCTGTNKDGKPCRSWALWSSHDQKCRKHTTDAYAAATHSNIKACRCDAYAWPHRPGSGLCKWPDVPEGVCTTPASTHKSKRRVHGKTFVFRYDASKDHISKLEWYIDNHKRIEQEDRESTERNKRRVKRYKARRGKE